MRNMQSHRSNTPPCPGMKLPKFCESAEMKIKKSEIFLSLFVAGFFDVCVHAMVASREIARRTHKYFKICTISGIISSIFGLKMEKKLKEKNYDGQQKFALTFLLQALLNPDAKKPPNGPRRHENRLIKKPWKTNGYQLNVKAPICK
jgi:hypothetical protein